MDGKAGLGYGLKERLWPYLLDLSLQQWRVEVCKKFAGREKHSLNYATANQRK